jgi:hypothetical protein
MGRRAFFTTLWQSLLKPALRLAVLLVIIYACVTGGFAAAMNGVTGFVQGCLNILIYILPQLLLIFAGLVVLLFTWRQIKQRLPVAFSAFLHKYSNLIYSIGIVAGWVLCYIYSHNNIGIISFILLLSLYDAWMVKSTARA